MFRAVLLSIVLTMAAGQDAVLLCKVWCDHSGPAAAECHTSPMTSLSVTGDDSCDTAVVDAVAFVREDGRRGGSAPTVEYTAVVARFRFAPPPTGTRSSYEPGQQPSLEQRPLVTALRI